MPPKAKKAKITKKARDVQPVPPAPARRRRGKLEDLPNMPLDIVVEILAYLEPLDLLHLTRTSKAFRAVLLDRSNAFLWRIARKNVVDLPECPEGTPEPAYINFLYCMYCHECGQPNSQYVYFDIMARYCKRCETRIHKWQDKRYSGYNPIERAFPSVKFEKIIQGIKSHDILGTWKTYPVKSKPNPHYDWGNYGDILETNIQRMRTALTAMNVEERTGYIAARKSALEKWRDLVPSLISWFSSRDKARAAELLTVRKARERSIYRKLMDLGWRDELELLPAGGWSKILRLPGVRQSKELTDRAWEKIKPSILEYLEGEKEKRLRQEYLDRLQARLEIFDAALPNFYLSRPTVPSELDIALGIPRVREVIDGPPDTPVDESSFDFLEEALPPFIEQWNNQRISHLAALVVRDLEDIDPSVDPLKLAVACRFTCTLCGHESSLPKSHRCKHASPALDEDDVYGEAAVANLAKSCWVPGSLESNVRRFAPLVQLCGLDPTRATVQDMEQATVRLACRSCDPESGVLVMNWYAAFHHLMLAHRDDDYEAAAANIYAVPEQHTEAARKSEQAYVEFNRRTLVTIPPWWRCAHCPQTKSMVLVDRISMGKHVHKRHKIDRPTENRDFWHAHDDVRVREPRDARAYLLRDVGMKDMLELPNEQQDALQHGFGQFCDFL